MGFLATTIQAGVLISVTALSLRIAEVGKTEIRNKDFMKEAAITFDVQSTLKKEKALTLKPLLVFFNKANQEKIDGKYKIAEVKIIGKDTSDSDVQRSDRENIRRIELVPAEHDRKYAEIEIVHREGTDKVAEERTTHEILSIREEERDVIRHGESTKRFVVEIFNKISEGKFEVYTLELRQRDGAKAAPAARFARFVKPSLGTPKPLPTTITPDGKEITLELREVMSPKGRIAKGPAVSGEVEINNGQLTRIFASVESASGEYKEISPGIDEKTKAHNQFAYRGGDTDGMGMASGSLSKSANNNIYYLYFSSGPYKGYRLKYESTADASELYEQELEKQEAQYAMDSRPAQFNDVNDGYEDDYVTEAEVEEINDRQVAAIAGRNQVARGIQRLQAEDGYAVENVNESPNYSYVNNRIDALYEKAEMDIDSLTTSELEVLANLEEMQELEGGYNFSN